MWREQRPDDCEQHDQPADDEPNPRAGSACEAERTSQTSSSPCLAHMGHLQRRPQLGNQKNDEQIRDDIYQQVERCENHAHGLDEWNVTAGYDLYQLLSDAGISEDGLG